MEFTTISNNGSLGQYTNSCIWITILHFLKYVKRNATITLTQIRNDAEFNYPNDEAFDLDKIPHKTALQNFLNKHHLAVHIYYSNDKKKEHITVDKWLGNTAITFGDPLDDGSNVIPIVSYGNHFELIISGTESMLPLELDQRLINDDKVVIKTHNIKEKQVNPNSALIEPLCDELFILKTEMAKLQDQYNEMCKDDKNNSIEILHQIKKQKLDELNKMELELGKLNNDAKSFDTIKALGEDVTHHTSQITGNVIQLLSNMSKKAHEIENINKQMSGRVINIEYNIKMNKLLDMIKSIQGMIDEKEKKLNALLENHISATKS